MATYQPYDDIIHDMSSAGSATLDMISIVTIISLISLMGISSYLTIKSYNMLYFILNVTKKIHGVLFISPELGQRSN